jgi:hypothetical protein
VSIDNVLVVRWGAEMQLGDVAKLAREVSALNSRAGRKLCFATIVPEETETPSAEVRDALNRMLPTMLQQCDRIDAIFLGDGVKATMLRAIARGMAMLTRRSDAMSSFPTVDAWIEVVSVKLRVDRQRVLSQLRADGIG